MRIKSGDSKPTTTTLPRNDSESPRHHAQMTIGTHAEASAQATCPCTKLWERTKRGAVAADTTNRDADTAGAGNLSAMRCRFHHETASAAVKPPYHAAAS